MLKYRLSTDYELNGSRNGFYEEGAFEWRIIHFFHEFALSARYYNLSKLTNGHKTNDPLAEWWSLIGCVVRSDISPKKLQKIESASLAYCDNFACNSFTLMRGLDGQLMTTLEAVMYPQLVKEAAPFMLWYVFKIIQPFYHSISDVVEAAHAVEESKGIDYPTIPYMAGFFPFLLLGKSTVIKRRKWS